VLAPDHRVARQLLTRFAIARIAHAEKETPGTARELAEASRSLCAMTGRTCVYEAIAAADELLLARSAATASSDVPDASANSSGDQELELAV
jgi:hypothetical protein